MTKTAEVYISRAIKIGCLLLIAGLIIFLASCVEVKKEYPTTAEDKNVCVDPPADEVAIIRADQPERLTASGENEIPWGFLPQMDTIYYSLEDTPDTEVNLLRKLQQQTRDCREKYNNKITKSVWFEVPWSDERAVYRTAYMQGIGSFSHLGTDLVHPSLAGRRNQNIGWDEAGCRVSVHEDIHGAGITHMQNRIEFEINKEEYQKVYTNCDDACVAHNFRNYSAASFKNFPYEYLSLMHYPYKKAMNNKPNVDIPFTREPTAQDIQILQSIFGRYEDREKEDGGTVIVAPNKCNVIVNRKIDDISRLLTEDLDKQIESLERSQNEIIEAVNKLKEAPRK